MERQTIPAWMTLALILIPLTTGAASESADRLTVETDCRQVTRGHYVVDHHPDFVRWDYVGAEKAPLFMPDADPASFVEIAPKSYCPRGRFAKDKTRAFYEYATLDGAASSDFAVIGGEFSRSKNNVYWGRLKLPAVDVATFTVVGRDVAKDAKRAYYKADAIPLAQLKSLDKDHFKIGTHYFYHGREIELAEGHSLTFLNSGWSKDDVGTFFHEDSLVPGVDASSFRTIGESFWGDRNGVRPDDEVDNVSVFGLPEVLASRAVPVEKSAWAGRLAAACRIQSGRGRCLTDGRYLIAVVALGGSAEGHLEVKAIPLTEVRYDNEGHLLFGSELYLHLKRQTGPSVSAEEQVKKSLLRLN